jgi:hypothetical protein
MTDTCSTYYFIFCIKDIHVKKQNCIDKPNILKDNDYFVHKTCSVDKSISFVLFVTVLISIYCTVLYMEHDYSSQVNVMIFKLIANT